MEKIHNLQKFSWQKNLVKNLFEIRHFWHTNFYLIENFFVHKYLIIIFISDIQSPPGGGGESGSNSILILFSS